VPAAEVAGLAGDTVGRLRLVGRSASDGDGSTSSTDRLAGVERWTYRLLLVLAALALANSNPTLRQMFDALT
jgi:hypothetical protein